MLAHELAHIRRHDYLVNLLQSAVETLLFYHPAVWWVSSAVRAEREHCCDDLAVVACGDAVLYARALTAIETLRHEELGVAMAITGSPLLARVRRLLGVREPATAASSGWIVALLTALMVSGAGVTSWIRGFPLASFAGDEIAASAQSSAPQRAGDAVDASGRCRGADPPVAVVGPAATASRHRRRQLSLRGDDRGGRPRADRSGTCRGSALGGDDTLRLPSSRRWPTASWR